MITVRTFVMGLLCRQSRVHIITYLLTFVMLRVA